MRKSGNPVKLAALIFTAMFTLNTAVMYIIFGINVFNPVNRAQTREAAGSGTQSNAVVSHGYNPDWKSGTANSMNSNEASGSSEQAAAAADPVGGNSDSAGSGKSADTGGKAAQEYFMTATQVAGLEKLDVRDKLTAVAALSKLGGEKANKIYDMAQDGVTYSEYKEIEEMLGGYLSTEEIENLKAMLENSIKSNSRQAALP